MIKFLKYSIEIEFMFHKFHISSLYFFQTIKHFCEQVRSKQILLQSINYEAISKALLVPSVSDCVVGVIV